MPTLKEVAGFGAPGLFQMPFFEIIATQQIKIIAPLNWVAVEEYGLAIWVKAGFPAAVNLL